AADDAPATVDAPVEDAPAAIDAPVADAPRVTDAPTALDAPVADVPPALDVPAADAGVGDGAVTCRSSRECGALSLVCDPVRMLCVECLTDVDCTGGQVCGADAVCRAPRCAAGPSTCAEGRVRTCDPRTGYVDMVCPAGMGCLGGRCQARACAPGSVECGAGAERRTCSADGATQTVTACPGAANAAGRCTGAGACSIVCNPGYADCNGSANDGCEADTRSDVANCGACRTGCGAALVCVAGACTCAGGALRCDGRCVDAQTDAAHCGACGRACAAGTVCTRGACACPAGLTLCGGRCVNLQNDGGHCGACGAVCSAGCAGGVCPGGALTCGANSYDVNGLTGDGCEVLDDTIAGHTQSGATPRGSQSCSDTATGTINNVRIPSDARPHSPSAPGFVATVGAAPDWYSVRAVGGTLCANNYGVTVVTSGGSSSGSCYVVTLFTDRTTASMAVSGSGSNTMSSTAFGLYTEDSTVYLRMEKVCSLPLRESVEYTITYHL
ncbi:MAG: hypothetical protein Q8S73_19410, partial [Deltaproteobacteria bacterium]|nr:hypothetical protein [Deltaproteobacteria bacterium]